MQLVSLSLSIWPECPANFDANGLLLALLTLPPGTQRSKASSLTRTALRVITGQLLGIPTVQVTLSEGHQGPKLTDVASDIHVSLSYAGNKALIGLSKGRAIGVDIVVVENLPEIEVLSRIYLSKAACLAILNAPLRDASFALAWAKMEACCKALNLPLAEINGEREYAYAGCEIFGCRQINGYKIAVALV